MVRNRVSAFFPMLGWRNALAVADVEVRGLVEGQRGGARGRNRTEGFCDLWYCMGLRHPVVRVVRFRSQGGLPERLALTSDPDVQTTGVVHDRGVGGPLGTNESMVAQHSPGRKHAATEL